MRPVLIAAGLLLSTLTQAQTFSMVPQVGLAGAGATVQWGFTPYLAVSAGYTALDASLRDVKTSDATYAADISLRNPQLMLNWAPFGGHFRVSAGAMLQNSRYDLTATDIQGTSSLLTSVSFRGSYPLSVAPALSVGWESPLQQRGLGYHLSAGAYYAGQPELTSSSTCASGVSPNACNAATASERRKVEDELSRYRILPILQAGLLFRL